MKKTAVGIFLAGSLAGLCLRWLLWPPSAHGAAEDFVYVLVLLLFPGEYVAVAAGELGRTVTWALMLTLKSLLFVLLGLLAAVTVRRRATLAVYGLLMAAVLSGYAWWLTGGQAEFFSAPALGISLLFYPGLLLAVWWTSRSSTK